MSQKVPVILDTDIGGDVDDIWALAMLLKSPEIDLKMVVTDSGNTTYRAALTGKLLEIAGRTDVPVAVGVHENDDLGLQADWLADYELSDYPGTVYEDGIGAMIDMIMASPEPVTLLCIGPVPNIKAALAREPRIVENARIVGMFGSVRLGYDGSSEISDEYNVRADAHACRQMFESFPEVIITPLDTCGLVKLEGEKYQKILACEDPLIRALVENVHVFAKHVDWMTLDSTKNSSVLFDTVAVYLAFSEELLKMEEISLHVTDDGFTRIDENGPRIRVATKWHDLPAFEDFLVKRLTG